MARGYIDTQYIDFPDNIDQNYLRGLQTPSGLNFTDLARELDAALAIVNAGIDPLLAMLLAPRTTEAMAEGGDDGSMTIERRGQYSLPRPQFVEGSAHMLSVGGVHIGLGFTEAALKRITLSKFRRNTRAMANALTRGFRADCFYRLFSPAEISIDAESRSSAKSPGFAGSGTGGNAFIGVYPDGSALPGGYSHYFRDTSANRAAALETMLDTLKRWHQPPFDFIGSSTMITALAALTGGVFVDAGSALIRPAQGAEEALVDSARYVGVLHKEIRVWHSLLDWTSDHGALFKSYGDLNPLNPLVMRYDEVDGPDAYVQTRDSFPLANSIALWTYGMNVNNRTGAALVKIAAADPYDAPIIVG